MHSMTVHGPACRDDANCVVHTHFTREAGVPGCTSMDAAECAGDVTRSSSTTNSSTAHSTPQHPTPKAALGLPLKHLPTSLLTHFLDCYPKLELHCHLEGAVTPSVMLQVTQQHHIPLPAKTLSQLRNLVQVTETKPTLLDFLAKFEPVRQLFTSPAVAQSVTEAVIREARQQGLDYLELRFSPHYMASAHGLDIREVTLAVVAGVRDEATRDPSPLVKLILVVERQMGLAAAKQILALAEEMVGQGVVALDLANDEFNYPPGPYAEVFQRATAAGLRVTVHAGEAAGAENVRVAVEQLGAQRIGHGVRAVEDPEVLTLLVEKGVCLEVCPTSNALTGAVAPPAPGQQHPVRALMSRGVAITINTDDPAICGITLSQEWLQALHHSNLTLAELRQLTRAAVQHAFVSECERVWLQQRVLERQQRAEQRLFESLSDQQLLSWTEAARQSGQ